MRPSPRCLLAVIVAAVAGAIPPARAADVNALLAAVAAEARFAEPALATGTLVHTGEAGETTIDLLVAGRRGTLRIDAGPDRALVRRGRAMLRRSDAPARLTGDATIAGSNVRFGDLGVFTARLLVNPQIVDEGLSGTVVAAAPSGTSPYALLVFTLEPERAVVTQAKYYEFAINNLVKRDGRDEFVEVAGSMRPTRITTWDVQGSGTSEIELAWRAAPELGRAPFTRAGLAEPLGP